MKELLKRHFNYLKQKLASLLPTKTETYMYMSEPHDHVEYTWKCAKLGNLFFILDLIKRKRIKLGIDEFERYQGEKIYVLRHKHSLEKYKRFKDKS